MAPSNFYKAKWMGMVNRTMQRWNCWQKDGVWPTVIYRVLTCPFKSQHLRIPRQPAPGPQPSCLLALGRLVENWLEAANIRDSPDAGCVCTCPLPGPGSLDLPTFQWPQCGFGIPVLLILNTRGVWLCGYVTKQVQVMLSFLFAGKLPSSLFKWYVKHSSTESQCR